MNVVSVMYSCDIILSGASDTRVSLASSILRLQILHDPQRALKANRGQAQIRSRYETQQDDMPYSLEMSAEEDETRRSVVIRIKRVL